MTLDEAIIHAREVAERNRAQYKNCPADRRDIEHQTCEQCAKDHEQLAEWLEELKEYRKYVDLTEIPDQYKLGFQDGIVNGYKNGYDKAIDDFVERTDSIGYVPVCADCLSKRQIREIADQLKEENTNDW